MAEAEVRCVDFWCNEFGMRVRIALREKNVEFEFVEEDLRVRQRSELVLRMNPVYRSIPILIHRGRPICESMNIVEYVDEVWSQPGGTRLLPADPLERAHARFWANFVDQKVFDAQHRFFMGRNEAKETAKAELVGHLKRLEEVLGDKAFFGGDEFGLLDVALVPFSSMFYGYEKHGGVDMEVECPVLARWVRRCHERESVRSVLPTGVNMYEIHKFFYGIE
ncbi:hypothetical protein ACP70R_015272 [Stipagrostis hirtigluma subsp. patula]